MRKASILFTIIVNLAFLTHAFAESGKPIPAGKDWFARPVEPHCPDGIKENNEIVTKTPGNNSIPLTQKVMMKNKGSLYNIPAGYLSPWPSPEDFDIVGGSTLVKARVESFKADKVNERDRFGIAMWYPSGRHPEIDWYPLKRDRTCENGRPSPKDEEFILYAEINTYPKTPLELWNWSLNLPPLEGKTKITRVLTGKEYGLERYESSDRVGQDESYDYITKQGESPEMKVVCPSPLSQIPNPSCFGYVYFKKENLYFGVDFPPYYLPKWREILNKTKNLIISWKIDNKKAENSHAR